MKAGVMKSRVLHAVAAVLIAAVPMAAHHSFSADSGKVITWNMEGGIPSALKRSGITLDIVHVGDTIAISGFRARDNSPRASRCEVTTADGKKYNFGGAGEFRPI